MQIYAKVNTKIYSYCMVLTDLELVGNRKKKQFMRCNLENKNCALQEQNENGKLMANRFYLKYLRGNVK